ncbi:non-ribosomal peptide synthetase [Streptomyces palmae]|uniref:Amino acid adenylation domain-containing protein n=1 Tax=Streptomyces palmae TaxID=1701085 RepID=A0A4Z0FVL8_9ACTN|nr:amino acid adenylation domain-containing protein [Streptomyces palmae]TGA86115.1 amino acid adenylation domain-containing protein [Streptomyces palmae]
MTSVSADVEFWADYLADGGFAPIPRWSTSPAADGSVGDVSVKPSPSVLAVVGRVAAELEVAPQAVQLAVHARALRALTGEREVLAGALVRGSDAVPVRLDAEDGSWRELVLRAQHVWSELPVEQAVPVAALEDRFGSPVFETLVDLTDGSVPIELPAGVCVAISIADSEVRLLHRTGVADSAQADRLIGYHLTALGLMAEDLDAHHHEQSLVSAAERHTQLVELAGPLRQLPDQRFHELFEERVRAHPDRVAAVAGAESWTYATVNSRANRIARALLADGLAAEDVVAVVMDRGLDWLAAVIGVFKAGGVYLPIEPDFPAERITQVLTRSDCTRALTVGDGGPRLVQALAELPGTTPIDVARVYREVGDDTDPKVAVGAGQLAYIYFTSGSTGLPKGAMCEHAGMLNHLYAKIDDLGIESDQVVAQTAPQCFDISLWQLLSALLVGGRTLIVPQDAVLDVPRYLDTVITGGVGVLQVVPSYLEVLLTHLEQQPRPFGAVRIVSATGEPLKRELVQRWFASYPGIPLVNAYGLTETSDDTNHEVMTAPPEGDRVPLGPAVNNVRVYVVDEQLEPVPLGAPGEIVFSGVCVGRGYINDEERTRAAFGSDPHHPGERLYRSGDFGRWLPSGKLEFLGRRDAQVKLRGFRIEIGEIENAMLLAPGVRDAAVVVLPEISQLVGYYAASEPTAPDLVRETLAGRLPAYMVPAVLHPLEALPLTPNGKIDKKALTRLAAESAVSETEHQPPATATERRLAAAWAETLRIPVERIGRDLHFFESGGNSLSAVRMIVKLDRLFTARELMNHPVLSDLAAMIDTREK